MRSSPFRSLCSRISRIAESISFALCEKKNETNTTLIRFQVRPTNFTQLGTEKKHFGHSNCRSSLPSFPPRLDYSQMHFSLVQISLLLPTLALGLPSISSSHSLQDFDISSSSSSLSQANTASSFDSHFDSSHESNDDLYRYQNKVYLIRHGEKGSRGETGLNSKGKKRAKCLRKVRFLTSTTVLTKRERERPDKEIG